MKKSIIAATVLALMASTATTAKADPFGECFADEFKDAFQQLGAPLSTEQYLQLQIGGTDLGINIRRDMDSGATFDEYTASVSDEGIRGIAKVLTRACKGKL